MNEGHLVSTKRIKIDKANTTILVVIGVCSFVVIFCIIASKTFISQYAYQSKVASARDKTVAQLKSDQAAIPTLVNSYKTFVNSSTNIIGGSSSGTTPKDGSNAKIILDALPSTYDFPALITAIESLLSSQGVSITSITGTDAGSTLLPGGASSVTTSSTATPAASNSPAAPTIPAGVVTTPIPIPFSFTVQAPYSSIQNVITALQQSIRPIQVQKITISGSDSDLTMTVTAQTYFLPASGLNISTETIK